MQAAGTEVWVDVEIFSEQGELENLPEQGQGK